MTTAAKIGPALFERLTDRLAHCEQYLEAARLMASDARELLEAVRETQEAAKGGGRDE